MDNLGDMRSAVQSDLTIGGESSLFPPATVDLALNRAYRKIGAMFKWSETRDALKTSAIATHEYYNYPPTWRPDSIFKLTVDGLDYGDPLVFNDYMFEKENSLPSGAQRIWTNYGKRFFFFPIPVLTGDKNIAIFGYKFVDKMVLDGDITIFSYSMPEINEAIVLEATAILKNKAELQQAVQRSFVSGTLLISAEAKNIVMTTWTKISQEKSLLARTTSQFDVPDFFAGGLSNRNATKNKIGNF